MGGGSSTGVTLLGYGDSDVKAAVRALDKWQLVQKGMSLDEAEGLLVDQENKAREGDQDHNSLLARLGGVNTVKWIFADFYKRLMNEPLVNSWFEDVDMNAVRGMPARQSAFMCHLFGSNLPFQKVYRGQELHAYMRRIHLPMIERGLNEGHFDVLMKHLEACLTTAKVNQLLITETIGLVERVRALIFTPAPGEEAVPSDKVQGGSGVQRGQAVAESAYAITMSPGPAARSCPFHRKS